MFAFLSGPRREMAGILALTLAGGLVRAWGFPRLGLGHFDEGIYALSGLWILQPSGPASIDPSLIPYAPPGFSLLVGLAYFVLGISDLAATSVSLIMGTLTIPAAAWLARRAFGPGAGVAAAALAAFFGPHVAFSRIALTDAPFLLAWLVALALGSRFLERPGVGRGIVLGISVGLAQNLKYHGWLAGVIVVVTGLTQLVGRPRIDVGKRLGLMTLPAICGALVYWRIRKFAGAPPKLHGRSLCLAAAPAGPARASDRSLRRASVGCRSLVAWLDRMRACREAN
jgi:4-amino-4-deoxy-L-arabinose transferase-like glycosyltransferase